VNDVEIVSMDPADDTVLVVGERPLQGPFVPAARGDVEVRSVRPDTDGMVAQVRMPPDDTSVPMIVAPLGRNTAKESNPPDP
jgi:hypothetical protein